MTSRGNGWTTVAFGDVVRKVSDRVDPETSGLERYVAGEHMDTDDLRIRRWGLIGDGYLGPAFHMRFKPGQVLYASRRTYLRKVAVPDFEGVTANTTFVLEPKDPAVLLPEMLPYVMSTESFHSYSIEQSKGSVNPYINFSDLETYEFALPPLEDQRRMVDRLQALQNAYESHRVLIERADSLWLSMAASVIRDADTEMQVGDAFEIQIGRQRSPKYARNVNPCPYLRAANIKDGQLLLDDVLNMDFDDSDRERFRLERGDVLITEGCGSPDELGASARWDGEIPGDVCFQNTLIRLRPRPGLTTAAFAYVWARYAHKSGQFLQIARGSNILHIGARRLEGMRIRVPTLEQQKRLTDVLEDLDNATSSSAQRTGDLSSLWRSFLS